MFFGEMHNFTRHLFDFKKRKSLVKHLLIYIVPPPSLFTSVMNFVGLSPSPKGPSYIAIVS